MLTIIINTTTASSTTPVRLLVMVWLLVSLLRLGPIGGWTAVAADTNQLHGCSSPPAATATAATATAAADTATAATATALLLPLLLQPSPVKNACYVAQELVSWWEAAHYSVLQRRCAEAGMHDLAAKQASSLLRYIGVIPADKAFYEAGDFACPLWWCTHTS